MRHVRGLVRMARLSILPGGMIAYALGAALAYWQLGTIDGQRLLLAFLLTESANLAAHYVDEFADADTDALTRRTWFSGGSGVLPEGVISPRWALGAAVTWTAMALGLGSWWVTSGLLPQSTAWILGLGLLGGWLYSMPPIALERRGGGELTNALIGGLLMPLMGYSAQVGSPSWTAALALLPTTAVVLANLLAVHWADRIADAAVGRRTLPARLGSHTRVLHWVLVSGAYGGLLALAGRALPWQAVLAALATAPLALWAAARMGRQTSPTPSAVMMSAMLLTQAAGLALAA